MTQTECARAHLRTAKKKLRTDVNLRIHKVLRQYSAQVRGIAVSPALPTALREGEQQNRALRALAHCPTPNRRPAT